MQGQEKTIGNPESNFTEAQLVSFGNYLLSEERGQNTSELNQRNVTDADIRNWQDGLSN